MTADSRIRQSPEELTAQLARLGSVGRCTRPVTHLTVDSREVRPGSVFVALRGERTDGHRYIEQAVRQGARVVVHETGAAEVPRPEEAPAVDFVAAEDPRRLSGELAPWFHGFPARELRVVGVTGTNGKTTCSHVLTGLLEREGFGVGRIDSLGLHGAGRGQGEPRQLANILPEPVTLHRELRRMVDRGASAAVLEVSSYALAVGRVDGVDFDAAVLTNVTRDHLDVHQTMERYLAAKLRLFDRLAASQGSARSASLWAHSRFRAEIDAHLAALPITVTRYVTGEGDGRAPVGAEDELWAENITLGWDGSTFDLGWRGGRLEGVRTSLLGAFNVRNILAALAAWPPWLERLFGAGPEGASTLSEALGSIRVPGRLEPVENHRGARILVDYAHTDDALEQVLRTLSALPHRRLVVVLGCGGDRDREKRPLMGAVASRYAHRLWLTSDNPRTESPRAIIDDIAAGIGAGSSGFQVMEDREAALGTAVAELESGDILLVAGKGHEDTQIVGTEVRPFDDREVIREHLESATVDYRLRVR